MSFQVKDPKDIGENVFRLIGDRWMLVTAGDRSSVNTMTANWGGLGFLWRRNVATIYVRPTRYTYEFTEKHDCFTLSFFGGEYREQLNLCGTKSGRDMDKIAACGFTVEYGEEGAPYFAEAELVLVCKKLYFDDFKPAQFLDPTIDDLYKDDYHRVYIGEIMAVLEKG